MSIKDGCPPPNQNLTAWNGWGDDGIYVSSNFPILLKLIWGGNLEDHQTGSGKILNSPCCFSQSSSTWGQTGCPHDDMQGYNQPQLQVFTHGPRLTHRVSKLWPVNFMCLYVVFQLMCWVLDTGLPCFVLVLTQMLVSFSLHIYILLHFARVHPSVDACQVIYRNRFHHFTSELHLPDFSLQNLVVFIIYWRLHYSWVFAKAVCPFLPNMLTHF